MACDVSPVAMFWQLKTGTFAKSARFQVPKNGTLSVQIKERTPETKKSFWGVRCGTLITIQVILTIKIVIISVHQCYRHCHRHYHHHICYQAMSCSGQTWWSRNLEKESAANQPVDEYNLALGDRFWLFIQTLNNAKKPFNSIFNSKTRSNYSFKELIHSKISQFIHENKVSIQIKIGLSPRATDNHCPKTAFFHPKTLF